MSKFNLNFKKAIAIIIFFVASVTLFAQEEGVEINGVIWATRNVGVPNTFADNPEDYGMLYQWNSTVGWNATGYAVSSDGSPWDSSWTGNGNNLVTWDNNVCPAGWRVPKPEEFISLSEATGEWITQNGVNGYRFTDGDNSIFLPAAGNRPYETGKASGLAGSSGYYWHNRSWSHGMKGTSYFQFSKDGVKPPSNLRLKWANAHSIRCVKMVIDAPEETGARINGVIWATRNVGAPNKFVDYPEDYGMLYQWNSPTGWSVTGDAVSSDGSPWDQNWTGNGDNGVTWDNNVCPAGWRVPTPEEFISLSEADGKWITQNGVNGYRFTDGNNSIFLPAAGGRDFMTSAAGGTGEVGSYWYNQSWFIGASFFSFSQNVVEPPDGMHVSWAIARSIRCVKDDGTTGIMNAPIATKNATIKGYYSILGKKLNKEPKKGTYIILYSNGKAKKVSRRSLGG